MAKQPPPPTLIERLQEAQKRSTYWRDGYAPLLADVIEALIDTDHAVALERERLASWLDEQWPDGFMSRDGREKIQVTGLFGNFARWGAHHVNTPPNAQERG